MARPKREGLNYFPFDVDFFEDPKLLNIEEEHGYKGGYIAARFLCWIYRAGYFTHWDENSAVAMAKKIGNGVTSQDIKGVLPSLLKYGFLDQGMYDSHGILTSHGIQVRWDEISRGAKRRGRIDEKYNLISSVVPGVSSTKEGVSSVITPVSTETTPAKPEGMPQSKVKKTKQIHNGVPPAAEFKTMPMPEDVGALPEVKVAAAQQGYHLFKGLTIDASAVNSAWEVFKVENLTGKQFYESVEKVHTHFLRWIKTKTIAPAKAEPSGVEPVGIDHDTYMNGEDE